MQQIILALFPSILLIVGGYVSKQKRWLADEFWSGAEKLNYYVFFPALLFSSLANARADWQHVSDVLAVMLTVLAAAVVVLYALRRLWRIPPQRFGVYMQSTVRFNTYIGLAVVSALAQAAGAQLLAMILAVCVPLVNVLSIIALLPQGQLHPLTVARSVLKNPLVSSCLVGIAVNAFGVPLWQGIQSVLSLFATCSLCMGLLCVGAALQFRQVGANWQKVAWCSMCRLLAMPLFAYAACRVAGLAAMPTQVLVIFFGLPTASAAYVLTKVLKGDAALMAGVISMQTALSLFSLPLLMWLTSV